jgi:signal transduction histidine kinase
VSPVSRGVRATLLVVVVAAAYYLTGRLGLMLAIPPGYATAVWPPSGLALAAVLLAGWQAAPGVWLGSFLVNLHIALAAGGSPTALAVPATIALGAAAQALLGAYLIRRFVGVGNLLAQEFDVIRILLLGGPLACLLNPALSVTVLWAAGTVDTGNVWLNLWTWWVGDSIGVLVFTPLVLVWAARPLKHWLPRQLFVTLPLAALFATVVATFFFTSQREQARIAEDFEGLAANAGRSLQEDLQASLRALGSVEGLYASASDVQEHQFEIFAGRLLESLPAAHGLSWNEVVPGEGRARFERMLRASGRGAVEITELGPDGARRRAGERPLYVPVRFIVPRSGNLSAIGFDAASDPARREALERARDTGRVSATGRVRLAQQDVPGLLALMPVYRNGIQPQTLEARRRYLQGFAVAVFSLERLMARTADLARREGMAVSLHDARPGALPLYAMEAAGQGADGGLRHEVRLAFADRPLRLVFELPAQALLARRSWATWLVLAGGLLLTGLLGMLLLLAAGRSARVQALVDERTGELRRLNAELVEEVARRRTLEADAAKRADELAQSNAELQRQAEVNRQLLRSLRHSEGELRRTATQLSASNRELEQFAYVASHDLKAPLRSIGSFAQLLSRRHAGQLAGEAAEFLKFIQDGIQHMQTLIDDLLQLSRVDARRLEPGPVSMQVVLERACRQLTADLKASKAEVHAGPLPDLHADANMLVQLLQNLIANAVKFQRAGARPQVWVDAVPDGELWHFTVRDNGIGIDAQHLDHIFMVFKRLHTNEQYPGTGIGLALCRKVVQLHGGEIWAESTPGEGTTIHFTLPRKAEPAAAAA